MTQVASAANEIIHCGPCGAEVEEQDTGLWETGGDTADQRRYCAESRDHLHQPAGADLAEDDGAMNNIDADYGDECVIELASGRTIRTDSYADSPEGSTYVRVCDLDSAEVGYWTSDEWREAPEEVMGAILGAAKGGRAEHERPGIQDGEVSEVHVALGNRPEVPGRALESGETGGLADLADYLDEGVDEHDAGGAVGLPGRARLAAAKLREMPGQQGRRHHDRAAATTSPGVMIPRAGKVLTTTSGPGSAPLTARYAKALGLVLDAASRGERVSYRPEGSDLIEGDATGPLTADGTEASSDADVRQCFIGIQSWHRGEHVLTGTWPVSVMVGAYQADRLEIDPDFGEGQ